MTHFSLPLTQTTLQEYRVMDVLLAVLPEINSLYGIPQREEHHPEICTGRHIELCLGIAESLNASEAARFAVLVHDVGKALTPVTDWPKHHSHEELGIPVVEALCCRLDVLDYWKQVALFVCEFHLTVHRAFELQPRTVIDMCKRIAITGQPQFLEDVLIACESDARGREGFELKLYPQRTYLTQCYAALIEQEPFFAETLSSREIQLQHNRRLQIVRWIKDKFVPKEVELL